jgi:TetR/AcrR family fatty acid metabolism transcriptional regulator
MSTTPTRRLKPRLPRDERMARILAVARAMLVEKGHDNILTAEVAERCAISEATIYKYFPSKRDLLIKVAEQWFDELLAEQRPALAGRPAPEALHHVVWTSLQVVRREPALTRFVLLDLRPDPAYRAMPVFELNRRFTSQVTEVLRAGVASGELRSDVPLKLVRDMIFGCIEHQTWAYIRGEGDFSVDEVTTGIVSVVLQGLASAAAPAAAVSAGAGEDRLLAAAQRLEQAAERLLSVQATANEAPATPPRRGGAQRRRAA